MGLIESFDYCNDKFEEIKEYKYGENWPVVYVIEGKKEAYVGETINAYNRCKQHYEKPERRRLHLIHIISDDESNKSATLDIESLLIEHMAADGKYMLQNGNGGLSNHNYFDRERYQAKFEIIWEELRKKNIVKKGIFELRNSDLFKYSPYKSLNDQQCETVSSIVNSIANQSKSTHLIQGEPGTGKTIVAVYLMKYLKEYQKTKNLKIGLVVPMTSLRGTLKKVFRNVKDLKSSMVLSPFDVVKDNYDVLIVDEAHRLNRRVNISNMGAFDNVNRKLNLDINKGDQLDWIKLSAKHIVLCYDKNQSVRPSDILPEKIAELEAQKHDIQSQMRVLGGQDYIEYIHNILHTSQKDTKGFNNKYDVFLFEDVNQMYQKIREQNKEYGLCRMVAGYAWKWKSKNDPKAYDIIIGDYNYRWNSTQQDWVNSENAINEIGCIHTIQGYDLNYVGVIIGNEISYRDGQIQIDSDSYYDKYGKQTIKDKDILKNYILNIYKTLLTRGIRGTYIYICDRGLREYFKQYVHTYEGQQSIENKDIENRDQSLTNMF